MMFRVPPSIFCFLLAASLLRALASQAFAKCLESKLSVTPNVKPCFICTFARVRPGLCRHGPRHGFHELLHSVSLLSPHDEPVLRLPIALWLRGRQALPSQETGFIRVAWPFGVSWACLADGTPCRAKLLIVCRPYWYQGCSRLCRHQVA